MKTLSIKTFFPKNLFLKNLFLKNQNRENQAGMSLIIVMAASLFVAIVAVNLVTTLAQKQKLANQSMISNVASQIKDNVVSIIQNPNTWGQILTHNANVFASAHPPNPLPFDLYNFTSSPGAAPVTSLYYAATNPAYGFNPQGVPCQSFDATNGNDQCPFRYEMTYSSSYMVSQSTVYVINLKLLYRPQTYSTAFNPAISEYNFTINQNFNSGSVEQSCIAIGGTLDPTTAQCSIMLNQTQACPQGTVLKSPPTTTNQNCQRVPAAATCPQGTSYPSCQPVRANGGQI